MCKFLQFLAVHSLFRSFPDRLLPRMPYIPDHTASSRLQDQIRQITGPTIHRRKGDRGSRLPALASAYTVKMTVLTGSVLQSIQVF